MSASVHVGTPHPPSRHPLGADTPQEQTPPLGADTPWEQTPPEQTPPWEQTTPREQTPPRSRHPPGADTPREQTSPQEQTPPLEQTPPSREMATAADGTHPTGMHSCSLSRSLSFGVHRRISFAVLVTEKRSDLFTCIMLVLIYLACCAVEVIEARQVRKNRDICTEIHFCL